MVWVPVNPDLRSHLEDSQVETVISSYSTSCFGQAFRRPDVSLPWGVPSALCSLATQILISFQNTLADTPRHNV